ncbi:MAG: hypothetical protein JXK94_13655, partial [Deltaproteobacteria bacterium]|nr:hypothetical protein [Deltaproteobacteria bacterium]
IFCYIHVRKDPSFNKNWGQYTELTFEILCPKNKSGGFGSQNKQKNPHFAGGFTFFLDYR